MPTETTLTPRQLAAQRATRSRIRKARERRLAALVAKIEDAGYIVQVLDPDTGLAQTFSTDPR